MTGTNYIVFGLGPSSRKVEDRHAERDAGTLKILKRRETRRSRLELQILDGETEIMDAIARTRS
jgi:hypothetical protein